MSAGFVVRKGIGCIHVHTAHTPSQAPMKRPPTTTTTVTQNKPTKTTIITSNNNETAKKMTKINLPSPGNAPPSSCPQAKMKTMTNPTTMASKARHSPALASVQQATKTST